MCGIYGMVSLAGRPLRHRAVLERMGAALVHRGPDDSGVEECRSAAVGTERLSIVDRRREARQPFTDPAEDGGWLVCNGEIYNAPMLRGRFPKFPYRSRGDVEPLVPLLSATGESGLDAVVGMFAIAWWRPQDRTLVLARDRAGEKPLFYTERDGEVWFASEIQALLLHPEVTRELDDDAVVDYLALGHVLEPRTMFKQIRKVPAGVSMTLRPDAAPEYRPIATPSVSVPGSPSEAASKLGELLEGAVTSQLQSDVPVGVFSSGGLDSTLVTALAMRSGHGPVRSFTASFVDPRYDESAAARRAAQALGSVHAEVRIGEPELHDALQWMIGTMAEPLADPAVLPTYLLSREAKKDVGVVLTGEGADELFGGYPTYLGHRISGVLGGLPRGWARTVAGMAGRVAAPGGPPNLPHMLQRLAEHSHAPWRDRHMAWFGTGLSPHLPATAAAAFGARAPDPSADDPVTAAQEFDFKTYLREGLLVKLDRATMAVSLEARAPYLDANVIGFAAGLPTRFVVDGWRSKRLLKAVGKTMLPGWVGHRRKRGLSVPIGAWINGGLRREVDRLLDPDRLAPQGVLSVLPIDELLSQHRAKKADHGRALWALIVLQYWLERWALE